MADNRTRKAIFEFDKLIRSIYTLRYLRDPQLQRDVHRSQNRVESYHQLRSFISQVSGKKQLIGKTDLDVAISNQCGRLISIVVTAYNSIMLSMLLERFQADGKEKALALLHIHFLGHYTFRDNTNLIDRKFRRSLGNAPISIVFGSDAIRDAIKALPPIATSDPIATLIPLSALNMHPSLRDEARNATTIILDQESLLDDLMSTIQQSAENHLDCFPIIFTQPTIHICKRISPALTHMPFDPEL